jgi:hypothetical protein
MQYSHSYPWNKPTYLPGQTDTHPTKKKKKRILNKELKRKCSRDGGVRQGAELHVNFQ